MKRLKKQMRKLTFVDPRQKIRNSDIVYAKDCKFYRSFQK